MGFWGGGGAQGLNDLGFSIFCYSVWLFLLASCPTGYMYDPRNPLATDGNIEVLDNHVIKYKCKCSRYM